MFKVSKPHIRRHPHARKSRLLFNKWICRGWVGGAAVIGEGVTPMAAYNDWKEKVSRRASAPSAFRDFINTRRRYLHSDFTLPQ